MAKRPLRGYPENPPLQRTYSVLADLIIDTSGVMSTICHSDGGAADQVVILIFKHVLRHASPQQGYYPAAKVIRVHAGTPTSTMRSRRLPRRDKSNSPSVRARLAKNCFFHAVESVFTVATCSSPPVNKFDEAKLSGLHDKAVTRR